MAVVSREIGEAVLFYAGQSPAEQVVDWARTQWELSLRMVAPVTDVEIDAAVTGARAVIIDATEHPGRAMDVLLRALRLMAGGRLAVYTEQSDQGLELFVRLRGAMLLMGPMSQIEWGGFFQPPRNTRDELGP